MLDFPVSWPVVTLAAAARVLLVFAFPRWHVRHRDASAPPALASVRGSPSVRARCALVGALLAQHPGEPLCLFYGLLAGFACEWFIDFSCTQGVDCVAQVTALRRRDSLRICYLFPMLHTGLPWFCTRFPQARAQRKPGPGIADIFLTASPLVLARAYEHAQARILTLLQRPPYSANWADIVPAALACQLAGARTIRHYQRRPPNPGKQAGLL